MSEESKSVLIKKVRVLFPSLFTRPVFKGEEAKNYGCKILLHKVRDAEVIEVLKKDISFLITTVLREKKLPAASISLTDGEDSTKSYYEGYYVLSANSRVKPYVVAPNGKDRITDPDQCKIYSGCNVDCRIGFWAQQAGASWGKRVNCNLLAIRFSSDGEPYESGGISTAQAIEGFGVQEESTETTDW